MNLTVAKTAGFCFGVKRAVDRVYEQIDGIATRVTTRLKIRADIVTAMRTSPL